MTDIIPVEKTALDEHAKAIAASTKSEATKRAYRSDIKRFHEWGNVYGNEVKPCDEKTLAAYAVYLSTIGRKPATIARAMTAINQWHVLQGYESPVNARVRETNKGIRNLQGSAQRRARPITWTVLDRILNFVPGNAIGIRDRALLLLGFCGAFRRSELVSIDVNDIEFIDEGMVVTLHRSKTDQEGKGRKIPIPFIDVEKRCPVQAVRTLAGYAQSETGPLFYNLGPAGKKMLDVPLRRRLRPASVALIVKRYVKAAGYDPREFSGHSLRAGFATSAASSGASSASIMTHTGHRSHAVMMTYIREGTLFKSHPLISIVSSSLKDTNSPDPG